MKKFWISFIALLMGVVIGVGIWHGIAYKDNLTSFVKDTRSKIESVFVNKDNVSSEEQKPSEDQPTPDKPSEEQPGPEEPGPVEPHVHKLSEWNIVNEPICITVGAERRWCDCGYYEERDIPALGHDYVDGVCSRCGESDPNYVEEVASIDGLYYRASTDGTVNIFQIEGAKFVQF